MTQDLITEDPRASLRTPADCLDIPKSTVHTRTDRVAIGPCVHIILHEDLHLRNMSSVWMPHELTEQNKLSRVNSAEHIRHLFSRNKMVVADET